MAYVPAVLMTVGIAVVSLWEAPHLPPPVMSLGDKVLHGLMYTVLAICWAVPMVRFQISNFLSLGNDCFKFQISRYAVVVLGVTMYGALMEVLQRFCTLTRSGEMADVLADFIGAAVGVIVVGCFYYLTKKRKEKYNY